MSTFKTIAWENWNVLEEEQIENDIAEELLNSTPEPEEDEDITELNPLMFFGNRQIYTPLGSYSADTPLKPSNRWDCWIGHTNFEITGSIAEIIEDTKGVEVLKIMGRYTFFIGVARLFEIQDVRNEIENILCHYTEDEILSDAFLSNTVSSVKKQLDNEEFWSIMIGTDGSIEYVSSHEKNSDYIESVQKLVALKNKVGGIIIHNN